MKTVINPATLFNESVLIPSLIDYMLGRNAFKYLLTDIASSMCREDTGITFMVGPDSANGGRNVSKPGFLTDAVQETFDELFESFAYYTCFKYLIAKGRVEDASPPAQGHYSPHRTQLFSYIGSVRRQDGHQLQELLEILSTFTMNDREQRDPKYMTDSSDQDLQADAPVGPSNNVEPNATSTTPVAAPLTTLAPSTTGLSPPRMDTIAPAATVHEATMPSALALSTGSPSLTASPSAAQNNSEDITEIASYTMLLKEFGDEDGVHAAYEKQRV